MLKRIRRRLAWWLWKPDTISIGSRLQLDAMGQSVTTENRGQLNPAVTRWLMGFGVAILLRIVTCNEDLRGE